MEIAQDKVVTINYTLTDNDGNVIDQSSDGSFSYLHGANNIVVGLENAPAATSTRNTTQPNQFPPMETHWS